MINYTRLISAVTFTVLFLTALFLFMRNYPSDRLFSGVFVVAGGVLFWFAWGVDVKTVMMTEATKDTKTNQ